MTHSQKETDALCSASKCTPKALNFEPYPAHFLAALSLPKRRISHDRSTLRLSSTQFNTFGLSKTNSSAIQIETFDNEFELHLLLTRCAKFLIYLNMNNNKNHEVLIVDDDRDTRYALTRILGKCGCTTTQACSVEEALQLMGAMHFDVVFSDMRFHGELGGEELLETVKNLHPLTDVVLMSCAMGIDRKQSLLAKGAAECLEKPFFKATCEDALNSLSPTIHQKAA